MFVLIMTIEDLDKSTRITSVQKLSLDDINRSYKIIFVHIMTLDDLE